MSALMLLVECAHRSFSESTREPQGVLARYDLIDEARFRRDGHDLGLAACFRIATILEPAKRQLTTRSSAAREGDLLLRDYYANALRTDGSTGNAESQTLH